MPDAELGAQRVDPLSSATELGGSKRAKPSTPGDTPTR